MIQSSKDRMNEPHDPFTAERIIHLAAFRVALRLFLRRTEEVAKRWGLTPQRYLLLLTIKGAADGREQLTLSEIAERLQLSPNSATELCARAEDLDLVRRTRSDEDRRKVYVSLTVEGERRLRGCLLEGEVHREELRNSFGDLVESFAV